MQVFLDGPRRRVGYELRIAQRSAKMTARRTRCTGCDRRRLCASVDLSDDAPYCLAECWIYRRGLINGIETAQRMLRYMLDREFNRVFHPAAAAQRSGANTVFRCDLCGEYAPRYTTAWDLVDEHGWLELGRDAHLCPSCRPDGGEEAILAEIAA